jgi:hypothetical protein
MKMLKKLVRKENSSVYHFVDGVRVEGIHKKLRGDVTGLRGDVTGLRGDVTGLRGDVDDCELTTLDRKKGINIMDLIG